MFTATISDIIIAIEEENMEVEAEEIQFDLDNLWDLL